MTNNTGQVLQNVGLGLAGFLGQRGQLQRQQEQQEFANQLQQERLEQIGRVRDARTGLIRTQTETEQERAEQERGATAQMMLNASQAFQKTETGRDLLQDELGVQESEEIIGTEVEDGERQLLLRDRSTGEERGVQLNRNFQREMQREMMDTRGGFLRDPSTGETIDVSLGTAANTGLIGQAARGRDPEQRAEEALTMFGQLGSLAERGILGESEIEFAKQFDALAEFPTDRLEARNQMTVQQQNFAMGMQQVKGIMQQVKSGLFDPRSDTQAIGDALSGAFNLMDIPDPSPEQVEDVLNMADAMVAGQTRAAEMQGTVTGGGGGGGETGIDSPVVADAFTNLQNLVTDRIVNADDGGGGGVLGLGSGIGGVNITPQERELARAWWATVAQNTAAGSPAAQQANRLLSLIEVPNVSTGDDDDGDNGDGGDNGEDDEIDEAEDVLGDNNGD